MRVPPPLSEMYTLLAAPQFAFSSEVETVQTAVFAHYLSSEHAVPLTSALFLQPSNAATALDDEADYIVSDGNSAEDLLDDSNDPVADFPAPPVSALAPLVERRPSNEESGAEVALQILALCIDLFGSATAPDYEQMLQVRPHTAAPHRTAL